MKAIVVIVMCALSVTFGSQPSILRPTSTDRVLLIAREASYDMAMALKGGEVSMMRRMLTEANHTVIVASTSGKPIIGGTDTLTPDLRLADVHIEDYAAVIIPCMMSTDFDPKTNEPEAVAVVGGAVTLGKPVAAQLSGVLILAATGALIDKDFAMHPDYVHLIQGGYYQGAGVVQDGNLITSGTCPIEASMNGGVDGTPLLVRKLIALIPSTGMEDEGSGLPRDFELQQNYPNPFNPSTTIRYGLPTRSQVSLAVFNMLGERVGVLVEGEQAAGYHDVRFDGHGLPSGMYFYRMRAGAYAEERTFLLVR